jgi:hypothetical protein
LFRGPTHGRIWSTDDLGRIGSTDASRQTNPSSSGIRMVKHHPSCVRMSQKEKGLTPEPKMSGEEEGGPSDRGFHVDEMMICG